MKKLSFLLCATLMFVASACNNDEVEVNSGNAVINISAQIENQIGTRAISDASGISDIAYAVYQGSELTLIESNSNISVANGAAQLNVTVETGSEYTIVLFADSNSGIYSFNAETATVNVDYSKMVGNSDLSDAFFGVINTGKVDAAQSQKVVLSRPLAQINFGASDKTAAEIADVITTVTIPAGVPQTLNLISGAVSNNTTSAISFTAVGACATDSDVFPGGEEYTWVTMDYVLAGTDAIVLAEDVVFATGETGLVQAEVSNIKLQRNCRTNIAGELFQAKSSLGMHFDVTYDENFGGDENIEVEEEQVEEEVASEPCVGTWSLAYQDKSLDNCTVELTLSYDEEGDYYYLYGFLSRYDYTLKSKVIVTYDAETGVVTLPMQYCKDTTWSYNSEWCYENGYYWVLSFGTVYNGSLAFYYYTDYYASAFDTWAYTYTLSADKNTMTWATTSSIDPDEVDYCTGLRIDIREITATKSMETWGDYPYLGTMTRVE